PIAVAPHTRLLGIMASFEDEMALFDAEINSIVETAAPSTSTSSEATISAPPTKIVPPVLMPSGGPSNHISVPVLLAPPIAPIINFGAAAALTNAGGFMLPPQLRNHPAGGGSTTVAPSTIESKPQMYTNTKADDPLKKLEEMKTMALPADVELNELRKAKQRNEQNSYLGQVQRGEKKMKRFVRCAGGETWEDSSLAEWDPNDFRVFCGDLGNEVSEELLAKAFRKYPSFQKAKVVRDSKSNKSKGYGFVSFKSQEDYIKAMREMDGKYVGNRPIKLRKSNWKDRSIEVVKKKIKQKKKLGLM
ncbi:hypothetical protein PFISCL1PPCAC_12208, partial [Pristionchus fissidentatus]